MKSWNILLLIMTAAIGFSACSPKPQSDCGYVQNVYGERISWKGQVPITMVLNESVPKEYEQAIVNAAETWNRTLGKTIFQIDLSKREQGTTTTRKDTKNVIYFYDHWEADRPNEQARTSIYWKGDLIEEADIRVNAVNFNFYSLANESANVNSVSTGAVNIESLIIHEMGHVLGLRHNDKSTSVMATYLKSNTDRVKLSEADMKSLKCEY